MVHKHPSDSAPAAGAEATEEETLDPENWPAMRQLGHKMVDDIMTYLQTVRSRPVWQPIPDHVRVLEDAGCRPTRSKTPRRRRRPGASFRFMDHSPERYAALMFSEGQAV